MNIQLFEQSGFIIEANNTTIAIDIGSYTPLEKLSGIKVDYMFASHIHGDHFSIQQIKAINPKKLLLNSECLELFKKEDTSINVEQISPGKFNFADFEVEVFSVDHGPNISKPIAENFGFLFHIEGKKIYFAGDMFYETGIDVTNLEVDYALIPIGGHYTFDAHAAKNFCSKFKSIGEIIPVHFRIDPSQKEIFRNLNHVA